MVGPEATIESYLKNAVETAGGECIKIKASGERGVPDRVVVLNGVTMFVELKAPKGNVSRHQHRMFSRLMAAGALVFVLDSKDMVDDFIVFCCQDDEPQSPLWMPGALDS